MANTLSFCFFNYSSSSLNQISFKSSESVLYINILFQVFVCLYLFAKNNKQLTNDNIIIIFLLCEPSFCHCCKIGWKLVSDVWEHMNYWKRVFFNCFDVLNPNIKSFLLLVEWKIIKHKTICVFVTWAILLSLL